MKSLLSAQTLLQHAGLLGVLALLILIFGATSDNFLKPSTFASIANQIPDLTLVAVGMTLVLVIGGIDLSVGSVLALSSAVLGFLMVDHDWSLWTAIPLCALVGACCGLLNGSISVLAGIPSFIVTLGMLETVRLDQAYHPLTNQVHRLGAGSDQRTHRRIPSLAGILGFIGGRGAWPDTSLQNCVRSLLCCHRNQSRSGANVWDSTGALRHHRVCAVRNAMRGSWSDIHRQACDRRPKRRDRDGTIGDRRVRDWWNESDGWPWKCD